METIDQVSEFLKDCINYIGLGFNPDTDFNDYISIRDEVKLFSEEQAAIFNDKMKACFEFCELNDIDIYDLSSSFL